MTKLAILLLSSNAHQEDGTVLLADEIFSFLGSCIRVLLQELIRRAKGDFFGKKSLHAVLFADELMSGADGLVNILDSVLEGVDVAILFVDDLLPVPLVDVPYDRKTRKLVVRYSMKMST